MSSFLNVPHWTAHSDYISTNWETFELQSNNHQQIYCCRNRE